MNILEVEDLIKGLPDQALQKEAQAPSGQVPQYLVVSEIQRRTEMRKKHQAESPAQTNIAEQIIQESIAPQQPTPQQPMPQQSMPQQPMPQPTPQQPPMPQTMYRGGIVEMAQGRVATLGLDEEDEDSYPGVSLGGRNPMSIRQGNQNWEGETGTYSSKGSGDFVEYESPEYSFRAADKLLTNYSDLYGLNSVRGILNRYAPPEDNNPTEEYIDFVSTQAGIDPDQELDLNNPEIRSAILSPMAQFESKTAISPAEIRKAIASVDEGYAGGLPKRDVPFMSPEVKAGIQVPTEGFPVPDVQTEDPRLNIPFINVGPEGGQREREFVDVESTEALLDAITMGKPFSQGRGRERQGSVSRFPTKDRQAGEFIKAIAGAIEADAKRTTKKDTEDPDQVKAVEAFTAGSTGVPIIVDKQVRKSESIDGQRNAAKRAVAGTSPSKKQALQSYMPDPLGQFETERAAALVDSVETGTPIPQYMPDPLGQFDAERVAALVDSIGEGATRKEFMAGMTEKPYMPDPLGQFDAERAAALVDSVGEGATRKEFMAGMTRPYMPDLLGQIEKEKKLYEKQYMPDPLGQFEAEKFGDPARLKILKDDFRQKFGYEMPDNLVEQTIKTGRYDNPNLASEEDAELASTSRKARRDRQKEIAQDRPPEKEVLRRQSRSGRNLKNIPNVPRVDLDGVEVFKEDQEAINAIAKSSLKESQEKDFSGSKTAPLIEKAAPKEAPLTEEKAAREYLETRRSSSPSSDVYGLMQEIAGTKEEAKREAFAMAMMQLGAGISKGDLGGGLSAAGVAASKTMGDYRDRALKGKLAELQLKRADVQEARYQRQEELSERRTDQSALNNANRALIAANKALADGRMGIIAALEDRLKREPTTQEIEKELEREKNKIVNQIATSYGVDKRFLGGTPIKEEDDFPDNQYQTNPSDIKFIGVN